MAKITEKIGTRVSAVFDNTQQNFKEFRDKGIVPAMVGAGERMGRANRSLIKKG